MTTTSSSPGPSTRPNRPSARKKQRQRRQLPIFAIVVVAVVVLGLAALVATRGGGGSKDKGGSTATGVQQTRPVKVTGEALPTLPDSGADPAVGKVIPQVDGQSFDGTPVSIANDGRAKLIFVIAHWCPHCQKEVPVVTSWLKNKKLPPRTDMFAISTSVNASAPNYPPSTWLSNDAWPVPTVADDANSTAGAQFGVSGFPFMVAVDANGKVVARTSGEHTAADLDALLAKATGSTSG